MEQVSIPITLDGGLTFGGVSHHYSNVAWNVLRAGTGGTLSSGVGGGWRSVLAYRGTILWNRLSREVMSFNLTPYNGRTLISATLKVTKHSFTNMTDLDVETSIGEWIPADGYNTVVDGDWNSIDFNTEYGRFNISDYVADETFYVNLDTAFIASKLGSIFGLGFAFTQDFEAWKDSEVERLGSNEEYWWATGGTPEQTLSLILNLEELQGEQIIMLI